MSREWKLGDLAMVTYRLGQCTETNLCAKTDKGWDCLAPGVGFLMHGDVLAARSVVIIDPEDDAEVERLMGLIEHERGESLFTKDRQHIQAALREYAAPTPVEPTGLGAVVYAHCECETERKRFVRDDTGSEYPNQPWKAGCGHHPWADLTIRDADDVLSVGVTDDA